MCGNEKLISILYDKNASESEKDHAVIDLCDYDDSIVEEALVKAAKELELSEMLLSSIGETLANIWIRKGQVDFDKLTRLPSLSQKEAIRCINTINPELFESKI